MATLKRFSFSCPHCEKELSSSWGDAFYGNMPDAFACPHCGRVVVLSPEQRIDKIAEKQSSRGAWWVFAGSLALAGFVAYLFVGRKVAPLNSKQLAVMIGGMLLGTFVLFGLIQSIRKAIAHDRLRAQQKADNK